MTTSAHSRIGAVILAAGMSTRMGEPKQLLRLGDRTVLGHVLKNVQDAAIDEIVLVLGFAADAIREELAGFAIGNLRIVINREYREGIASSISAGLAALNQGIAAALIVLADQPLVHSSTLLRIIHQYREHPARIVIPTYEGRRGNPVLLDRSIFPEAIALRGDNGCRVIFHRHAEAIVEAPVEDAGILFDIDSKEDFRKIIDQKPISLPHPARTGG